MSDVVAETLGLLPHPAARRHRLRRLHRADHLPALPQDGRRAGIDLTLEFADADATGPIAPGRGSGTTADALTRPLHRDPPRPRQAAGHPRRHLRRGPIAVQQPGQPQAARRPDRRDRMDLARRRREGRRLRGPAGEGRQRGEEGGGAVFHAPRPHPVDRPLHEARPPRQPAISPSAIPPAGRAASSSPPTNGSSAQTKAAQLDRDVAKRVRSATYYGQELVARPRRLALMNLFLHGIEPTIGLARHDLRATRAPSGST